MRNNMTREQMMRSCRSALSFLAGVDDVTMREVAAMNMRSRCNGQQGSAEVIESICSERTAANEDFSF